MSLKIGRKDGTYLKKVDPFMRFFPFIMKKRNESAVYFKQQIDVTELRKWLSTQNRQSYSNSSSGSTATFFHAVLAAMVQTIAERPHLNRFICGQRLYQRKDLTMAFVMKRAFNDEAEEEIVVMKFEPTDGIREISQRIREQVKKIRQEAKEDAEKRHGILNWFHTLMNLPRPILRGFVRFLSWLDYHGWLPKFLIDLDPMHSTMFVSNLGSLKVDAPFHHLYEWGTTSIFLTIGAPVKVPVVIANDQIVVREVINLAFTLDERISDGFYYVQSIKRLQYLLEHPETLRM